MLYDTIAEFNVDSKAECDQLNLAKVARKIYSLLYKSTRWPSGTAPDVAIARSRVRLPPVVAVYQRQLSVPSLQGRLMSTSESWGVNGHTTRYTSPVSVVLQLRLVSG